jgi:RNA polymerase sigma factor (sigma-70 family)
MPEAEEKDKILWQRFKEGDPAALDKIYMKQFQSMYNYGLKIHSDSELVKDCIQELFGEIWAKKENLGEAASIKFYLLKSIKRKIIKNVNKLNPVSSIADLNDQYNFVAQYSIEDEIINSDISNEQAQNLKSALEELSDRQREIIYLRFNQNLKFNEISEIMSIKNQSARNLLFEGVAKLKTILVSIVPICLAFLKI